MGIVCKNCSESKISVLEALAYSGNGSMRCSSCGKLSKLGRLISFLYLMFEGVIILTSLAFSFYFYMAWPLVAAIILSGVLRVFLLPRFAQPNPGKTRYQVRQDKGDQQRQGSRTKGQ